jgi:predicted nucleotidyltransferase
MAKLHEDWSAFLRLLNGHRVKFVIVGGHAVAAHGRPRLTADLDIFVQPTKTNAKRIVAAISEFGFGTLDSSRLTQPNQVVFMGREPFRIDVLTSIDGVSFESAWAHRKRSVLDGIRVAFLGRSDLIRNKRAAGRPKDLLDVALLEEVVPRKRKRKRKR